MKEIDINQMEGIQVGHAQNLQGGTGCTAILCKQGATASEYVKGGAPASRESALLDPTKTVEKIHCVMLSGGSAYGLSACDGAMEYLEEKNIGFDVGVGVVPIVCGASLFDLPVGDAKARPDKTMGYEACQNSENEGKKIGNVGAGTGACIGKYHGMERTMKGGLGTYAVEVGNLQCGAIVAVNCLGDVKDYHTGETLAGILSEDKKTIASTKEEMYKDMEYDKNIFTGNTTIGCIITNGKLTKAQANQLAKVAHNGYAKAIEPAHTSVDGDSIFVLATGEVEVSADALGALATEVMAIAINNGIKEAESAYGLIGYKELTKVD